MSTLPIRSEECDAGLCGYCSTQCGCHCHGGRAESPPRYGVAVRDESGEAVVGFNSSSRWRAALWLLLRGARSRDGS